MVDEVLDLLAPVEPGLVVDGTVGAGGHAAAMLDARPDISLLGLDRDPQALQAATTALEHFGDRVRLAHGGYEDLESALGYLGPRRGTRPVRGDAGRVCFVLLDLGVSSLQLDQPARGFSYQHDGPLDMRMDPGQPGSAFDVVNQYPPGELRRVITMLGEERFAASIVRQIIDRRPLNSTGELVEAIKAAIPAPARRRGGHPAKRTFQAIRLEVNRELDRLARGLDACFAALSPGGRLAVLAYHSLEDRIVKLRFAGWSGSAATWSPGPGPGPSSLGRLSPPPAVLVRRRAGRPSAEECESNPRSRSARLRALAKVGSPDAGAGPRDEGTTS